MIFRSLKYFSCCSDNIKVVHNVHKPMMNSVKTVRDSVGTINSSEDTLHFNEVRLEGFDDPVVCRSPCSNKGNEIISLPSDDLYDLVWCVKIEYEIRKATVNLTPSFLTSLFENFGKVSSCVIEDVIATIEKRKSTIKGVAFVLYSDQKLAFNAARIMNDAKVAEVTYRCSVCSRARISFFQGGEFPTITSLTPFLKIDSADISCHSHISSDFGEYPNSLQI